eukprot:COSAG01_NODE_3253_length_6351_cov_4.601248_2_plen_678_part_00
MRFNASIGTSCAWVNNSNNGRQLRRHLNEGGGDEDEACTAGDLGTRFGDIQRECCDEPSENCRSGMPASCNPGCAVVATSFWADCKDPFVRVSAAAEVATFQAVLSACQWQHEHEPEPDIASLFGIKCSSGGSPNASSFKCIPECDEIRHGNMMLATVDGDDARYDCQLHHGLYSWVGSEGYLGRDVEYFVSTVLSGGSGFYGVIVSENNANVYVDLIIRPDKVILIIGDFCSGWRYCPFTDRSGKPIWGAGGFTVEQHSSLQINNLILDGALSIDGGGQAMLQRVFLRGHDVSVAARGTALLISCIVKDMQLKANPAGHLQAPIQISNSPYYAAQSNTSLCVDNVHAPFQLQCANAMMLPSFNAKSSCGSESLCQNQGSYNPVVGFPCDCISGFVGRFCESVEHQTINHAWNVASAMVGVSSLISAMLASSRFRRTVDNLDELQLPDQQRATGFWGALGFLTGVWDLVVDIVFCMALASCRLWPWFALYVTVVVVTAATTIYLGLVTLATIEATNSATRQWHIQNGKLVTLVLLLSASRLNSLAILRLRIFDYVIIDCPMEDKFFHFIRHCGMFRYFVSDIPQVFVAVALLVTTGKHADICGHSDVWLIPISAHTAAIMSIVSSFGLIAFGVVDKMGHLLLTEATAFRRVRNAAQEIVESSLSNPAHDSLFTVGNQ